MVKTIPLVDTSLQTAQIRDEVQQGLNELMESSQFILGRPVGEFEEAFAQFSGVSECVGVGNGTDALELLLRAAGIGPGDRVILPANTFIATALAVVRAGAVPVLVDSDPITHLISLEDLEAKVEDDPRAVIAVHLFGQMAELEAFQAMLADRGTFLLEDCAQCHGASRRDKGAGAWGLGGGTSFYPGKNLGGYGDGGAVLTNSAEIASKVRALRNYGSTQKYHHPQVGFNSRLDTIQAIVLSAKLKRLAAWNAERQGAASIYSALLCDVPEIRLPQTLPGNTHVWNYYVVAVPARDFVLRRLKEGGIEAGIHYPVPIHLQGAFASLGYKKGDFPNAEAAAGEIITLPLFPGITPGQQGMVAERLKEALCEAAGRA